MTTRDPHTLTNVCLRVLLCALKGGFEMKQLHVEWHVAFLCRIHLQVQEDHRMNMSTFTTCIQHLIHYPFDEFT